jgi:hypothetical protein
MRAHWKVNSTATGVIAVYEGRGGVGKVGSVLFGRAAEEEASAVGSTISFEAEALASGETACRMWLSSRSTNWGFTSDGRFFRPYMRAVARRITTFDPNAVIELN